ncbi:Ldh family oxidoreductase [Nannocystis radixulma]|uniref:Ldh family oxidoreductase n=1 Tax=Nannocystis radixulma TaxID=2995305 RepID=A0ABT5B1Z3_9BACT|nr:Ldh family oxidoreductase [Nannocystis radixulma]MDC0668128.1 Ldh family oxidoreductase [Nannocystis radixulma]
MSAETVALAVGDVRRGLVGALVRRLGLAADDAAVTVEHWLRTEQAGKPCHGLVRALYVTQSGEFGPYDGRPAPGPTRVRAGRLHVDGRGHLGYAVVQRLVERGCAEAEEHGMCVATGAGVYPTGALGDWARLACARGCGVIVMSGSPARVVAPGGRVPLVGTNPICVGLPTRPHAFVCDASTSAITHGDLLLAQHAGAPLPADAAVDRDGARTRVPGEVTALLSVGGSHKTFALGLAVELLTSLGGGVPGSPRHDEHGVFALFLGPEMVAEAGPVLADRLAAFAETGARIPGWESERRAAAAGDSVEMSRETYEALAPLLREGAGE